LTIPDDNIDKFQLSLYFLPIIGIIPALLTLNSKYARKEQKRVSSVSVTLFSIWLLSYALLWLGAISSSEVASLRLLYLNGLLTTGYFFTCMIFAFFLWRGKIPRLPLLLTKKK
jgi:hypothetical protein